MARTEIGIPTLPQSPPSRRQRLWQTLRLWLMTWELYPLLLLAGFPRLYQPGAAEFDTDQVVIFGMARDAIMHGLLPATSNLASIRIVNPPAVIYLLMIPAAISANPVGGVILVALLNIAAALLTYIFARRYFGRVTAIVSSLLYTTASLPVYYSRFTWQQNMIAPFVVLFLLALFWGAVERRKGWLGCALLLLGLVFQLHETTALLIIPLLLAWLLAPETVRWRDLLYGALALLFIFFPYLLWEFSTKFADITVALGVSKLPAHIDVTVFTYYQDFFSPYSALPTNPHSLLYQLVPTLRWVQVFMLILVIAGFLTATLKLTMSAALALASPESATRGLRGLWLRWTAFRSDGQRAAFLILLVWQLAPLLFLARHSVPLFPYYVLLLMPGPFILAGLFVGTLFAWLEQHGRAWVTSRYALVVFTAMLILAQTMGTMAGLIDATDGTVPHSYAYNTLDSMQQAVNEADQLAQQRHLAHIYISSDQYTQTALRYLAGEMRTPATVFDSAHCLALPNPASGPAVFLLGPADTLTETLLKQYSASLTLVAQPPRLGSAPFKLYIGQPVEQPAGNPQQAFMNHLRFLGASPGAGDGSLLVTRWQILRAGPSASRTTYTYNFTAMPLDAPPAQSQCVLDSLSVGDQLLVTFPLHAAMTGGTRVQIAARYYVTQPYMLLVGPLRLETTRDYWPRPTILRAGDGANTISFISG